jgi:hypothetical protein
MILVAASGPCRRARGMRELSSIITGAGPSAAGRLEGPARDIAREVTVTAAQWPLLVARERDDPRAAASRKDSGRAGPGPKSPPGPGDRRPLDTAGSRCPPSRLSVRGNF